MLRFWLFIPVYFILICTSLYAQEVPIGSWQSHYSYLTAQTVEVIGDQVFCGSNQLTVFDTKTNEYETYSKANGLTDVGIALLRYDANSEYLYIVYANGNIDLWHHGTFRNIPDIKNYNVTGSKRINDIFFRNKLAYFSTDFAIVVFDPSRFEIKESYILQENSTLLEIKGLTVYQDSFYAATNKGVYKADVSSPFLQNYSNWYKHIPHVLNAILNVQNKLFAVNDTLLMTIQNAEVDTLYEATTQIVKFKQGTNKLYICESDNNDRALTIFDTQGVKIDSNKSVNPMDVVEFNASMYWVADYWRGLMVSYDQQTFSKHPEGIYTNSTYNLNILNNELFVSSGGERSWIYTYNGGGISVLNTKGDWHYYNRFVGTPALDSINDIMEVAVDKRNGKLYAASFVDGLWEYDPATNTANNFKNTPYIQSYSGYRLAGLAFDKKNNLWISNYGAPEQLVVKKADGSWQKFGLPYSVSEKSASQIVIDDADQKWIVAPRGVGVFVYNDNESIDNKNDDQVKLLKAGEGQGNLASNEVNCLAKDKNGKIWVGTVDGITIYNCPESMFSADGCDGERKIVKYDLDAGYLFQRENVRTIAIDGANNKWIGTNNGVWLISDDAEKIIYRFNAENSPLPSNEINRIIVHPQTGQVFIATASGLVSFRGNATEGSDVNDDLLVFPNPVPNNYSGTIAIKGLVANADVRITDVSGQLVYRTIAQGGQAVWNGKNYLGEKPSTGVYYVFVTNSDGSQTKVGKFIYQ